MGLDRICNERGRCPWESPPPLRGGGLRLSRLRLLWSRLWSHGEKDGERRWRGDDEEELLKDGDPRCRGGLRERARMGLRERERCRGSPKRDEAIAGGHPATGGRGGDDEESGIVDAKGREMCSMD